MEQWPGIRDDQSAIGSDNGVTALVGVSFSIEGELGRRPGMTAITNSGGIAIGAFRSAVSGTWLLIAKSNGDIVNVAL